MSLPPFSSLAPENFYGNIPQGHCPPHSTDSYYTSHEPNQRVLGDCDMNLSMNPLTRQSSGYLGGIDSRKANSYASSGPRADAEMLEPHAPSMTLSHRRVGMESDNARPEDSFNAPTPSQRSPSISSGASPEPVPTPAPAPVLTRKRAEFTVKELEKILIAVLEVDPFMCKRGEAEKKWTEVLEHVQSHGYCSNRTWNSVKNKVITELDRVESKQTISTTSYIWKELENDAERLAMLNGKLDSVAAMRKHAVNTKEEDRKSQKDKQDLAKLQGNIMRDGMCRARFNPNDSNESSSDNDKASESESGRSTSDDNSLSPPPPKKVRRDTYYKQVTATLEEQTKKTERFQEEFLKQQRELTDKLLEESRKAQEIMQAEAAKNREQQEKSTKDFLDVIRAAFLS
ncbi:hypothetical protein M422DRAFT_264543 [Sphaerobolus stellatus SS14]|uniref:Myb/SANT-like DNA-binding domain-containing protein n=1 Tax=Sphaerobolus stellatus (strain SS14) TaxID=990650 RepID=A0A0C9V7R7_SPHS4|nr:hypothetical protein M422DRAFT_264543 [Sphaerobolus stellatus SS14]